MECKLYIHFRFGLQSFTMATGHVFKEKQNKILLLVITMFKYNVCRAYFTALKE